MGFSFTEGQRMAIESRGGSVLVSAAAGSGKTRVLTERLMSYVTDEASPANIDRFLVITYTRAAAAELKSRIIGELGRLAAADPLDARLRRQQSLCYHAHIGTIHSFCTEILRENCHLLGLSPAFKVMDDDRARVMKSVVLERLLDSRYEALDKSPEFRTLADTVGAGRDDSRLSAVVLSLYEKIRSHPYPEDWAAQQSSALQMDGVSDISETIWGQEILSHVKSAATHWSREMDRVTREISGAGGKIAAAYFQSFEETACAMRDFVRALDGGWDTAAKFLPISFPRLGGLRGYDDPDFADRVKLVREGCKKAAGTLAETFSESSERQISDMRFMAPAMQELLRLTMDFDKAFTAEKRRQSFLDFSDLEHCAAQLLVDKATGAPTWAAFELSQRFTEIMVDEYQDVNAVQDMIFRALSRGGKNLFMVGDVKQSIYRFRLADPTIFLEKYRRFKPVSDPGAPLPEDGGRILLQENFRSRASVLDAANLVFSNIMSMSLGEMDYDADACLKFGAVGYPEGTDAPAELDIISPDSGDDEDTPEKSELEARFIAAKILAMMREPAQVYENGAPRDCQWRDFVLLLRSPSGKGAVFHRVLAEAGIPVQSRQGSGFFTSVEVTSAINMLAVIDNPHADVPLISVLRCPAFGFDGNQLSAIRACDKKSDFYGAICSAAEGGDGKCAAFLSWLNLLRRDAPDLALDALIWRIYNETDLLALCSAMSDGDTRRANLMYLFEYARKFEETGGRGIFRFVTWLRRMAERGDEPSVGDSGNAVGIMSIHKSKGLEFPFVFLCDLSHRFNRGDSRDSVLLHSVLGLGPKFTDIAAGIEYPTIARRAIERRLTDETLSEEMRVLYVGMTRARERLFMTCVWAGVEEALEKLKKNISSPVSPELLRSSQSFAIWLAMAALTDDSVIKINITDDVAEPFAQIEVEPPESAPDETYDELRRKLSFVYPYNSAVSLPSKLTATEMKGGRTDAENDPEAAKLHTEYAPRDFRTPDFSGRGGLSAAEKGTATHIFLQFLDYSKTGSAGEIESEVARLSATGHLSREQAQAVDVSAVQKLFSSDLGRRMLAADRLKREFKFTLLENASTYYDAPEGDMVLMQGVIDCFIVENGEITVIDYKTDRIAPGGARERAQYYAGQLRTYASAVSRICGLPVKECVLYFLRTGEQEKISVI